MKAAVFHGPNQPLTIEDVEIVFKQGVGYDPRKLMESVRGLVYAP